MRTKDQEEEKLAERANQKTEPRMVENETLNENMSNNNNDQPGEDLKISTKANPHSSDNKNLEDNSKGTAETEEDMQPRSAAIFKKGKIENTNSISFLGTLDPFTIKQNVTLSIPKQKDTQSITEKESRDDIKPENEKSNVQQKLTNSSDSEKRPLNRKENEAETSLLNKQLENENRGQ